ncbi:hypothetical protein K438DRAFT_1754480 [Mycena galopus ATCC 62051]|nr:hypothetical protein K438DRAFT_1754480 [Mycena galopus ATCC 62051]
MASRYQPYSRPLDSGDSSTMPVVNTDLDFDERTFNVPVYTPRLASTKTDTYPNPSFDFRPSSISLTRRTHDRPSMYSPLAYSHSLPSFLTLPDSRHNTVVGTPIFVPGASWIPPNTCTDPPGVYSVPPNNPGYRRRNRRRRTNHSPLTTGPTNGKVNLKRTQTSGDAERVGVSFEIIPEKRRRARTRALFLDDRSAVDEEWPRDDKGSKYDLDANASSNQSGRGAAARTGSTAGSDDVTDAGPTPGGGRFQSDVSPNLGSVSGGTGGAGGIGGIVGGNGGPGMGPLFNFHCGHDFWGGRCGMDAGVQCGNVYGGTGGSAGAGGKGGPSTGPFLNFDRTSPTVTLNIQY